MLEESRPISFRLEVVGGDRVAGELDDLTRNLAREIEDTGCAEKVAAETGEAPGGAKAGEAIALGMLLVEMLPAALPPFIECIKEWIGRGANRTVKITTEIDGRKVQVEFSPKDLQAREVSELARELVGAITPKK